MKTFPPPWVKLPHVYTVLSILQNMQMIGFIEKENPLLDLLLDASNTET